MTEEQLQYQCFIWFWNTYPQYRQMLFHVDNNSVNSIIGNKKKALGVVSGVSDFCCILPGGRVMFIEMKTETGRQTVKQREFMIKVQAFGHQYMIIRSLEEFKKVITIIYGN